MDGEFYESFVDGTMEGHVHPGLAARAGITAATLAQAAVKRRQALSMAPMGPSVRLRTAEVRTPAL